MRLFWTYILILVTPTLLWSQREFHVFPKDDHKTPGTAIGNGSLQYPWDLQTALSQSSEVIKGGDIIWLHQGVYKGRFTSTLKGQPKNKIVVASFGTEKVILDGNVDSNRADVLRITGGNVVYKNFEITFSGNPIRQESNPGFKRVDGLIHTKGEDCEFINLKIYNVPGLGVGSWKSSAGSIFDGCLVYNNGYVAKNGKGTGEGFYVQNTSDKTRIIKNCIVFNNYYKGIEVWSANKRADFEYVKNITLDNNVLFNNGLPSGHAYDNIIVASDDRNGINIAQNVMITNNILYHNTNFLKNEINGNAPSLTLGFHENAPVENITVKNNVIIGRNNALRILYAKTLEFSKNIIYSGYVMQTNMTKVHHKAWNFNHNSYFTKRGTAFFITKSERLNLSTWQDQFNLDSNSSWQSISQFDLENVLDVTQLKDELWKYRVTLFNKSGKNVSVDFSAEDVPANSKYTITELGTDKIVAEGALNENKQVVFPMGNYNKTITNFGVYHIQFSNTNQKKKTLFGRLFDWLF